MPINASAPGIKKNMWRYMLSAVLLTALFSFIAAHAVWAQDRFGVEYGAGAGLSTQDVRITIANIIRVSLGILGTVFLGLIIYGGVTWMTAGGDENKVEQAKKIIVNATIGLIVIFLAFAITSFVIRRLEEASFGGGGGPGGSCTPLQCGGCYRCLSTGTGSIYDPTCPLCSGGTGGSGFNVSSVNPYEGQTNVKTCARVQSVFNANLEPASVNNSSVTIREVGGGSVAGSFNTVGNSFSFTHPAEFAVNTTYEAHITTDVKSLSGDFLERERLWQFTTGTLSDPNAPQVDIVYPGNGDVDICLAAPIQVQFNEEMDVTTLIPTNIILEKKDASGAYVNVAWGSVNPGTDFTSFAAFPAGGFEANTEYRVTLLTGIADSCGNALAAPYVWTFTTGSTPQCTPLITGVNPTAAYYSEDIVTISGDYFFTGAGSDVYFNNFPADQNCFNATYVPNTICRVAWTNDEIQLRVPVGAASGTVLVDVGGVAKSNSAPFQVLSPHITWLSPSQGPVGSYVTLGGNQFGLAAGTVEFIDAAGNRATAEFPCSASWNDGGVVVKVPSTLSSGYYNVQLFTAAGKASNRMVFTVDTSPLAPGICAAAPSCGPSGQAVVLTGERFGATQGGSSATFGAIVAAPSSWNDTGITVNAPAFPGDGSYPITVSVAGLTSNTVPFQSPCGPTGGPVCDYDGVIDPGEACDGSALPTGLVCGIPGQSYRCVDCAITGCGLTGSCNNNDVADAGELCDDTDGDGIDMGSITTCQAYSSSFNGGTLACTASCTYDTSACTAAPPAPRVTENSSCGATDIQSPTPFKDSTDACTNALVGVSFDRDMDDVSLLSNINVRICNNGATFDQAQCGATLAGSGSVLSLGGGRDAYFLLPAAVLEVGRWYEGVVPVSVQSVTGVALANEYRWHFRVADFCTPNTINIAPATSMIRTPAGTQELVALASGSNCNLLRDTYTYTWSSSDTAGAYITLAPSGDRAMATAVAETGATPVQVRAEITGRSTVFNTAEVGVLFNTAGCKSNADCLACGPGRSNCISGVCTPVVDTIGPSPSPESAWVTIQGCYFGNEQGSVTYTPSLPGGWPDPAICGPGNNWRDTQIISEVPSGAQTGAVTIARKSDAATAAGTLAISGGARASLCRLDPTSGTVQSVMSIYGTGFATRQAGDQVSVGGAPALAGDYTSWTANRIDVKVPLIAPVGSVPVVVTKTQPSNALPFTVTGGGTGSNCDGDASAPLCQANDTKCAPTLFCSIPDGCTCQPARPPEVTGNTPGTGATNVCRNALIEIEFNQIMDTGSMAGRVEMTDAGTNPVGISLSFSDALGYTVATVRPSGSLDSTEQYRVTVRKEVKSKYGIAMLADFTWTFFTGPIICQINKVTVTIDRNTTTGFVSDESGRDIYLCAGRDDCADDTNGGVGGNQHTWTARAWDASTPPQELGATFAWVENDPDDLFTLLGTAVPQIDVSPTGAQNGTATFDVSAQGTGMGSGKASVSAEVNICENPWPSITSYPYADGANNCGASCPDTSFSIWYCRDAGSTGTADDIPALRYAPPNQPVIKTGSDPDLIKEFLFLRDSTRDAIGLKVFKNPGNLSITQWYQQNVLQPGSPSSGVVGGFPALMDGRTTYVLAANPPTAFTNVYVLSYNDGAEGITANIYQDMVKNWRFALGASVGNLPAVQRDLVRRTDLGTIKTYLDEYGSKNRRCAASDTVCTVDGDCAAGETCIAVYPKMDAGTFIVGISTSAWPSWQAVLGNALGKTLPVDPINTFVNCPSDFDQATCFRNIPAPGVFVCPIGSSIYRYTTQVDAKGRVIGYTVGAHLETIAPGGSCINYSIGP